MTKCNGCGAILQKEDKNKEGYVKDLTKNLCERCFKIRNYNDYKFIDKDNKYYQNIIKNIEQTKDLVILVTDFLNTESLIELNIKNPVLLVLAKRDLIPRHLDENKLLNNIKTKLNIVDKVVVCSKNNYNLDILYNQINKYKKTNKVYVIGYTNAGKSTLINKIIKDYGKHQTEITTSILPSTTLDLIEIKIDDTLTIIDTPGLLDEGTIILEVDGKTLNQIIPKKEIKPAVIQTKIDQTIIINNLFRIDVTKGTNLIFYMSNELKLERYYKPVDKLQNLKCHELQPKENQDIIIKGIGFIKTTKACKIKLYIQKNVKVSVRPSII